MTEYTKIDGFYAYVVRCGSMDVATFGRLSHAIAFVRSTNMGSYRIFYCEQEIKPEEFDPFLARLKKYA